jgi:transcriptional antiterminator NusG
LTEQNEPPEVVSVRNDVQPADVVLPPAAEEAASAPQEEAAPAEPQTGEASTAEAAPAEAVPGDSTPAEVAPGEVAVTEAASAEAAPPEAAATEGAPAEAAPPEAAATEGASAEAAPPEAAATEGAPAGAAPPEAVAAEAAPAEAAPPEAAATEAAPVEAAPPEAVAAEAASAEAAPAEAAAAEAAPAEAAPPEAAAAEATPETTEALPDKPEETEEIVAAETAPTEPQEAQREAEVPPQEPAQAVETPVEGEPALAEAETTVAKKPAKAPAKKRAETAVEVEAAPKEEKSDKMDWYILKVQSNREESIREGLQRRVKIAGLDRFFDEIIVPTEKVTEVKGGKKRVMKRKLYPGYIVVHMEINEDTWFLVRETPGIGDFTGAAGAPTPMLPHEVTRIVAKEEEKSEKAPSLKIGFNLGDPVKIIEGNFENFEGNVEHIDQASGRVTVMINIFGRSTPVTLEYWQIEAV